MLKASALYIVIIISLVIGVICSSLIVAAYFYKIQYQKKFRYDQLENNLNSGINILTASTDSTYSIEKTFSLFDNGADSVSLKRFSWGVYDVGVAQAFNQKDTLFKTFTLANTIDSSKWAVLYLTDLDYPLSLSGKTMIKGNAYLPKAGVIEANVASKEYKGYRELVKGNKYTSDRVLPPLNSGRLLPFENLMLQKHSGENWIRRDSIENSYRADTRFFNLGERVDTLKNVNIKGNVVIFSDTTLYIDSTAILNHILIYAKSIVVKNGFHGSCQLFAADSINVRRNCIFNYPSCLGVLNFKPRITGTGVCIKIDSNAKFNGIIFTYEKNVSTLGAIIEIGKNVGIAGQVYTQSNIKFTDSSIIDGSVFTSALLYKKDFTFYRGYLIDASFNSMALSPYYLTSELMPVSNKRKKVLQWLESN